MLNDDPLGYQGDPADLQFASGPIKRTDVPTSDDSSIKLDRNTTNLDRDTTPSTSDQTIPFDPAYMARKTLQSALITLQRINNAIQIQRSPQTTVTLNTQHSELEPSIVQTALTTLLPDATITIEGETVCCPEEDFRTLHLDIYLPTPKTEVLQDIRDNDAALERALNPLGREAFNPQPSGITIITVPKDSQQTASEIKNLAETISPDDGAITTVRNQVFIPTSLLTSLDGLNFDLPTVKTSHAPTQTTAPTPSSTNAYDSGTQARNPALIAKLLQAASTMGSLSSTSGTDGKLVITLNSAQEAKQNATLFKQMGGIASAMATGSEVRMDQAEVERNIPEININELLATSQSAPKRGV